MTHTLSTSTQQWKILARLGLLATFTLSLGCQSWFGKKKEEDTQFVKDTRRIQKLMASPDRPRLIGEVAGMSGIEIKVYESFGLVTGLLNTGGKVRPSEQRNIMLAELRMRMADNPEAILDDPSTALTKVRVFGNPGNIEGQILDVGLETSNECDATDLTGGVLPETRLREMAFVGGKLRSGADQAVARGELVSLPASYTKKNVDPRSAVIIGGGRLIKAQPLSILMAPEYKHVLIVKAIEQALNKRFYFDDSQKQKYVAEGKNSAQISITSVPKYRWDPAHFSNVILSTGFNESEKEKAERLEGCKKLLIDRKTARRAAAELEALGSQEAKEVLISGLSSLDTEIRFYSAYSLAYLDCKDSIPTLMEMARTEAAFRPVCLIGLAVNEHPSAREALEQLLQDKEPETRFGAFWAIRNRNPTDPRVQSEKLTKNTQLAIVPSVESLLAVSFQEKQELVLFGNNAPVAITSRLTPTSFLTISPQQGGILRLTRRAYGQKAEVFVESNLLSLLRGLGDIEASYNDFVHTIDTLQSEKQISIPVAFNPRPAAGRIYKRDSSSESLDLVSFDASITPKEKSYFGWLKWPSFQGKQDTKSESKTESEPTSVSLDMKTNSLLEPAGSFASQSDLGENELPEIDWDSLK